MKTFTLLDLEKAHQNVCASQYGPEQDLIKDVIQQHPQNDDLVWIAIKISVIDLTNSTMLTNYKQKISLYDLAKIILEIPNFDEDIAAGNSRVVSELAQRAKNYRGDGVNLFSFASKYCSYHSCYAYGKDDFSIFDSVLSEHLADYATKKNPLVKTKTEKWRVDVNYEAYNQYIADLLDEKGILVHNRRTLFDDFVWFNNRK